MIIRTNLLFPGIAGMTIWPFILIRPKEDTPRLRQHEGIHYLQWTELMVMSFAAQAVLYFGFDISSFWVLLTVSYLSRYLWYVLEFLIRLPKSCLINYQPDANWFNEAWDNAYRAISFEREAFAFDRSPGYLKTRKHFYWLKYVLK